MAGINININIYLDIHRITRVEPCTMRLLSKLIATMTALGDAKPWSVLCWNMGEFEQDLCLGRALSWPHRDGVSRLGTIVTRWKTKTWAQNREYIRRSTELSWPVLLAGVVCLSSGINNYLVLCSFDPAAVFGNIFICSGGERTLPSLIWRYLSGPAYSAYLGPAECLPTMFCCSGRVVGSSNI